MMRSATSKARGVVQSRVQYCAFRYRVHTRTLNLSTSAQILLLYWQAIGVQAKVNNRPDARFSGDAGRFF